MDSNYISVTRPGPLALIGGGGVKGRLGPSSGGRYTPTSQRAPDIYSSQLRRVFGLITLRCLSALGPTQSPPPREDISTSNFNIFFIFGRRKHGSYAPRLLVVGSVALNVSTRRALLEQMLMQTREADLDLVPSSKEVQG